jgi:hypothetical protein
VHPRCLGVRTANACRTSHAFVTLPLPSHLRTKAGGRRNVTGFASYTQTSSRNAKEGPRRNEIAAMVRVRVELARKPLRLRGPTPACETWSRCSRRARPELSDLKHEREE